ncbi:MAG: RnfABCDGE type electron transport complex subunit D [Lachnospiraceae bacterium]|nr:RnfABCDGE type electron transport complex subunit D [Lachnospiraceae bacterium]
MNGKTKASPHLRSKINTSGIMLVVILALMPATGFGIYNFGLNVLYLILVTVGTAVVTEYVTGLILKRAVTIDDYSAVVTGLLLALSLPPDTPLWLGAVGGMFAIVIVKMLFGGLGQNIMNPAMAARSFLFISFTPLLNYRNPALEGESPSLLDMLVKNTSGVIGETSMLAIILGAAFLIILGVIDLKIPGAYIISFFAFIVMFTGSFSPDYLASYLTGSLVFAAFFIATDYVTRPISARNQILYGILLGFLTAQFSLRGYGFEGIAFAVIIGNLIVPLLNKMGTGTRND